MNGIPWTAEGEERLRREIFADWIAFWICILGTAVALGVALFVGRPHPLVSCFFAIGIFCTALVNLFLLVRHREKLGEPMQRLPNGEFYEGSGMLANKPRSTVGLTPYFTHPAGEISFRCTACKKLHFWKNSEWMPTYQDGMQPEVKITAADGLLPRNSPPSWSEESAEVVNDRYREVLETDDHGRFVILCSCGTGHYKL